MGKNRPSKGPSKGLVITTTGYEPVKRAPPGLHAARMPPGVHFPTRPPGLDAIRPPPGLELPAAATTQ